MTKIFNRESEKPKRRKLRKQMPKAELLLWEQLRDKNLEGCKFRRQYSVGRYILDFYCPAAKLAIEIDGDSHFSDKAMLCDQKRQASMEKLGIRFLRFTNTEVFESLDGVLEEIRKNLPPPTPPCKGGEPKASPCE